MSEDAKARLLKGLSMSKSIMDKTKVIPSGQDTMKMTLSQSLSTNQSSSFQGLNEDYESDEYAFHELNYNDNNYQGQVEYSNNSKLPKEIFESMTKQPIITQDVIQSAMGGTSVLDSIIPQVKRQQKAKTINENIIPSQNIQANVDYSLIKTIVEDCVKKYANAIAKKVLSESKKTNENELSLSTIKVNGDKIQFLTENGDLFSAKLEFIKNIKKK